MSWVINGSRHGAISAGDRGLGYGDGLFETMAIRDGRMRFIDRHLARLQDGCRRLQIPLGDTAALEAQLAELASPVRHGTLKLIFTRGPGPRGYSPAGAGPATLAIGVEQAPPAPAEAGRIRICTTPAPLSPALAGLKTLGRLENVLARAEWTDAGIIEGLLLSPDGRIVGGTSSNVFVVQGSRLSTPALGQYGVRGIMRSMVMNQCASLGLECVEADLRVGELELAEEVFISNALTGIRPVLGLADKDWPRGPVTRRLCAALAAAGVTECAAHL